MSYIWVNAGMDYITFGGISMYIKYKDRKGPFSERQYPTGYLIKLIDRELFITKAGFKDLTTYLPMESYDYCLNMDIVGKNTVVTHNGIMFTYNDKTLKRPFSYDKNKLSTFLMGDSGGFSLISGTKEFIDPLDLSKWHTAYINQGMTLDLPPSYGVSDEYVLKSGLIQAKNNEILIKNCENVELYNIAHGFNVDQLKRHIDIVDNDTMKKWAIGSSYYGNLFDLIDNIFSVIEYKKSDSYHIFGISNTKILPLFAWIGKYYNITSDSSTPLQAGTSTIFFSTIEKILKKIRVGRVDSKLLHSDKLYPYLPCSCPICNALKTSEIFIKSNNSCVLHVLLSLHNVIAMSSYTKIWDDLATNSSIKEYKKIMDSIFDKKANLWKQAIDYIEYIMEHNLEKANIKFASYFSLFSSDSIQISDFSMFNNDTMDYKKVNEQRMDKIIDNYSKYYDDDFTKKIRRNTKKIDKLESTKYAKESIGIKTGNKSNSLKKKKKKRKEE